MRTAIIGVASLITLAQPALASWPSDPTANLPVSTASQDQGNSVIVADGSGGVFIAWDDRRNDLPDDPENPIPDVYLQHVLSGGEVDPLWPSNGLMISEGLGPQGGAQLVSDGAGGVLMVWVRYGFGANKIYAQHVFANGTIDPQWPANGAAVTSSNTLGLAVISDGSGGILATWSQYSLGTFSVYLQHMLSDGALDPFWPAQGIIAASGSSYSPEATLVSDGAHGCFLTWVQSRRVTALRVRANGSFAGGGTVCTRPSAGSPMPVSDGAGGMIVTWHDGGSDGYKDVQAHHVLPNGSVDPIWPVNGRTLCSAVGTQWYPSLVSDGNGGAIVAWDDRRTSGIDAQWMADVFATHVLANGALDPQWPVNGLGICTADKPQWRVAMVSDGSGGAVLAWDDFRNDNDDIYAQHVWSNGQIDGRWPINGASVSSAPGHQELPAQGAQTFLFAAATDGAGGSIMTWTDYRGGSATDIYAQRIQENGLLAPPTTAVEAGPSASLQIRAVNPVVGRPEVMWSMPPNGSAQLVVFDVSGRRISTREIAPTSSGRGSVKLERLPVGVYMIQIAQAGQTASSRIAVLR